MNSLDTKSPDPRQILSIDDHSLATATSNGYTIDSAKTSAKNSSAKRTGVSKRRKPKYLDIMCA
jgi:hypothetical protein